MRANIPLTNEMLKPLEILSEAVNHDEDRISVVDHQFISDSELRLTLGTKSLSTEAIVTIHAEHVCKVIEDFAAIHGFTDRPEYWFLKAFSKPSLTQRFLKEIKDVLCFKVSPLYKELQSMIEEPTVLA